MKNHVVASVITRRVKCTVALLAIVLAIVLVLYAVNDRADANQSAVAAPAQLASLLQQHCSQCHDKDAHSGGLDLTALTFDLQDRSIRDQWIRVHDRVEKGEMPPKGGRANLTDRPLGYNVAVKRGSPQQKARLSPGFRDALENALEAAL